jgi:hypothetical protein
VLAERLRPDELRFLTLFSSVSGRFGNRGQADYAAASEALNKLAQALDRAWPARVTAIDWGPWHTTGMASDLIQRQFAERGVELIDVEVGCRMLDEELCRGGQGAPEVLIGGGQVAAPAGLHALLATGAIVRRRGDGVEIERELSLARDTYLGDHRLDGRAVLPFAVATELMAEAAAAAAPGREVVELAGIRLFNGITVGDDAPVAARIVAEAAGDELDVVIAGDGARPRYRARARFAPHPGPAVARHGLDDLAAFPLGVPEAYAAYLFHGPLFRRIVSISGMDERGARAVVRACPPAQCIAGSGAARWWLDPIAMDCALQLQVLWARLNWGVTLLPAQIGAVRRLGPLEGEALQLELRIRPGSQAPLCHADHVFRAPDGTVLGELEDVVGTGSKALNRLAGPPRTGRFAAADAAAPHPTEASP